MTSPNRLRDWYGIDMTDPLGWVIGAVVLVVMIVPFDAPLWLGLLAAVATVATKGITEAVVTHQALDPEAAAQVLRARRSRKRTRKTIRRAAKEGAITSPKAISAEVDMVVDEIHQAARRLTKVSDARERIDPVALERARRTLTKQIPTPGAHSVHHERALAAIDDQIIVRERLAGAQQRLAAKIEAAVLGVERLDAQITELATMHGALAGVDMSQEILGSTSADLEALREALDEADTIFHTEDALGLDSAS